ncbi:hypothetical protein PHYPSEUDO_010700 [Phytophthora pseudosyringae]|uniref:M96 mating-specific protein family n=1 Tax=Phytophthora pseudosyringae TaxID=221518 RepID=A0A8T1VAN3_9STRA|nr:hypothetical protein PHYPSEUDO_010700 [Phytophthora pseudosyringae]
MSLFEHRGEDIVTVEEALAFIDSFESILGSDTPNSSESGAFYPAVKPKEAPKRKRRSNPPGYTTRVQQQKKAELQALRGQVHGLQQQVEQLKRLRPNTVTTRSVDPQIAEQQAKWELLVVKQVGDRLRSEETNRKLKTILAHQVEVDKNLRRILQKRSLLQGIDFVFGNEPTSRYSFAAFENSTSIVDHLEQKVAELYLDSGSVFQAGTLSTIACSMQMKHVSGLGMTAEALSTTPVQCPMEVAADICWRDLSVPRPCPEKWAQSMKGSPPHSHEKNWILTLQSSSYVKQVKGVQFLRKYEEPNRTVIIKADLMVLNNEELQFRDQTWTVISRSESNPNASVVRVREQMYLDRGAGGIASARPEDVEYAQSVVLRNLNWKLREHTQHLQDQLIEETQLYGNASAVAGY